MALAGKSSQKPNDSGPTVHDYCSHVQTSQFTRFCLRGLRFRIPGRGVMTEFDRISLQT